VVKVLRSFVLGPLEPYVVGFTEALCQQGYRRSSASQHICFIAHLDRWMSAAGIEVGQLGGPMIERYLAERRAAGYREYRSPRAFAPLLAYLGPLGVLPAPAVVRRGPVEELLGRYRDYLIVERGLTPATVRGYVDAVRPFVASRLHGEAVDMAGIGAADVSAFVLAACPGRAVGPAKLIVCALRSLLRWLHLTGAVAVPLATAVPSVAGWRLSGLPRGLEPAQLRTLLAACDRRTAAGRRDYAVLLLLSRLGLRAGEVAVLGLDDIDWRSGEIVVRGKGNRAERLPLPADVGSAIAAYLQRGRPQTADGRSVFMRVRAPHRALSSTGVTNIVCETARRAGLGTVHAHRLRHTAATAMLRAGGTLPEVGQVLRHRSLLTTAIYAKVDRDALTVLVRPWPTRTAGGVS
jgi:site-specific recombinase XerD